MIGLGRFGQKCESDFFHSLKTFKKGSFFRTKHESFRKIDNRVNVSLSILNYLNIYGTNDQENYDKTNTKREKYPDASCQKNSRKQFKITKLNKNI